MGQIRDFSDERNKIFCPYCGRTTEPKNRDHVPSKVLLDEPYPKNLPTIHPCQKCNSDFSKDEEYVPCLIEWARAGSASIDGINRKKIRKILSSKPGIASKLGDASERIRGWLLLEEDSSRIASLMHKLGQGHVAYELGEPILSSPDSLMFRPLAALSSGELDLFETPPRFSLLAETGSRALTRQVQSRTGAADWIVVQPGRYRYLTFLDDVILVRLVISEFLACEITWNRP